MNKNRFTLAMFDLDGTLFDTAPANYFAYRDACKSFINLDQDFFLNECFGKSYREFLPQLGISDEKSLQYIHKKKEEIYPRYLKEVRENEALFEIAMQMKSGGTSLALVTTASQKNTLALLSYFGYCSFFDLLVTQESVSRLKPSPEAFLYAMTYFNVEPRECIIFEDSKIGLQAAIQSGASVFKIVSF